MTRPDLIWQYEINPPAARLDPFQTFLPNAPMKRLVLLFFFALMLSQQSVGQRTQNTLSRIDSALTYLHQRELFNGTVLIAEKGKVLYKKAFGVRSAQGEPLTTTSSFNLASVSKQFYAMMAMMLKEQGKLAYDEPVKKHLPKFPYDAITIRHLLNQTSGLPEYFDIAQGRMTLLDTLTNAMMMDILADRKPPLVFEPGTRWEYCNTNYTTLGSVIESASGMKPEHFLQQYITRPLKMNNTYIYHLKQKQHPASRVFGFRSEGGKRIPDDLVRFDGIVGDGNVYSSVEDLLKWDQALYTEKLVKRATLQEAFTPGRLKNGKSTGYGFGWGVDESGKKLSHTGGWVGFRTIIVRYTDKNQTLIVLDNSGQMHAHRAVVNRWEGKPYALPQTQLITNIRLIDGTGLPATSESVRVLEDRIQDRGDLKAHPGEKVFDGKGQVLAPGFIDSHSHHDWGLMEKPSCIAATNQGITTIVIGQDGSSTPIDSLRARMKRVPVAVNIATYTGHATLRSHAMIDLSRNATDAEIDSMSRMLKREMDKGSLGLATGLEYEAAFYSSRDEVVALAKTAAAQGGRYISHIRSEDENIEAALDEIIAIGREAKIPVQISHFKIAMRSKWGSATRILGMLDQARQSGVEVTADVYPYRMWHSTPRVLFPKKDFESLASAEKACREYFDPESSVMTEYPANRAYEGKTVSEIARMNSESSPQALLRIIRESAMPGMESGIVGTSMSEEDIAKLLQWPHSNICSDGAIDGHPRGHGAFTRVMGRYVREQKVMPMEEAIHKMTGLTAEHIGIARRGLIVPGYYADLVLFDPATVVDNATITNATAMSTGITSVWVNGQVVFTNGAAASNFPGQFVHRANKP
jgi:N-acyl-D-aspartate/D-glutamate deacylase/CubicO group peptidase (beta-lactamase class C family)